jgi:hypothetical protein
MSAEINIWFPDSALCLGAGMPSEDTLRWMFKGIFDVAVREVIDELDHIIFDEKY